MLNVFDKLPPVDVVTYGAINYNPVQGGLGILGRYFKAGVKFDFAPPERTEAAYVPPVAPPPPAPATQTCADGTVIEATATCAAPPPPPPPAPATKGERG